MLRDNIIRSIASSSTSWKGAWADGTSYVVNDLVENDGSVYIATSNNVGSSSTEPGVGLNWTSYWDLFAAGGTDGLDGESFDWRGPWQSGNIYLENDVVSNNGSSYITTTDHTSTTFNEPGDSTGWTGVWNLMAEAGADAHLRQADAARADEDRRDVVGRAHRRRRHAGPVDHPPAGAGLTPHRPARLARPLTRERIPPWPTSSATPARSAVPAPRSAPSRRSPKARTSTRSTPTPASTAAPARANAPSRRSHPASDPPATSAPRRQVRRAAARS